MPRNNSLSIDPPKPITNSKVQGTLGGPPSPQSPRSPTSLAAIGSRSTNHNFEYAEGYDIHLHSPITSLPTPPGPPSHTPLQQRQHKPSKSIFANVKASKSTPKLVKSVANQERVREVGEAAASMPTDQNGRALPYRRSMGSTPELKLPPDSNPLQIALDQTRNFSVDDTATVTQTSTPSPSTRPEHSPQNSNVEPEAKDKRHRFPRLGRKTSMREEDIKVGDLRHTQHSKLLKVRDEHGPRTAPNEKDRGFRDMMSSSLRNRSADRYPEKIDADSSDDNSAIASSKTKSERPSTKDDDKTGFFSHIGTKAAGGFGRAKGAFSKLGRSGSSHDKETAAQPRVDPNYTVKILNLSLVEQTRITRISKRLEDCKDKTEFWMPSLPWRCIDYLNANGVSTEGIYRIPGSDRDIKLWQMRFDTELDIDLLHPDTPIYDINTISSLLKGWLRQLPDEIFPSAIQTSIVKAVQARLADPNGPMPVEAPQELRDGLSNLPPFNYYLLFAITCHISLLNAHHEYTKMPFTNLKICLQPCLKLQHALFQWLVEDWRNCWQGCWTEKEYLEQEYRWLESRSRKHSINSTDDGADGLTGINNVNGGQLSTRQAPAPSQLSQFPPDTPARSGRAVITPASQQQVLPERPKTSHQHSSSSVKSTGTNDVRNEFSTTETLPQSDKMPPIQGSDSAMSSPQRAFQQRMFAKSSRSHNDPQLRPTTSHASATVPASNLEARSGTTAVNSKPSLPRSNSAENDVFRSNNSSTTTQPAAQSRIAKPQATSMLATAKSLTSITKGQTSSRQRAADKGLSVRVIDEHGHDKGKNLTALISQQQTFLASPSPTRDVSGSPRENSDTLSVAESALTSATVNGPLSPGFMGRPHLYEQRSPTSSIASGPTSPTRTLPGPPYEPIHKTPTKQRKKDQHQVTTPAQSPSKAGVGSTLGVSGSPQLTLNLPPQLSPMQPLSPLASADI